MGHLLFAPLPEFSSLAEVRAFAAPRFEADLVAGDAVFARLPFGPVAVLVDGTVREAAVVAAGAASRVVAL